MAQDARLELYCCATRMSWRTQRSLNMSMPDLNLLVTLERTAQ